MKPTRGQLLALEPGRELEFEGMRVWRMYSDPRRPDDDQDLHFSKHYLEGKLVYTTDRALMGDLAGDPWDFISEQLDRRAADEGAHHRDGTAVSSPS